MHTWRKIVSLLVLSAGAALLGAACNGVAKDHPDTTTPAETTENDVAARSPAAPVDDYHGEEERLRCQEKCDHRMQRCYSEGRSQHECRHEDEECRNGCWREHEHWGQPSGQPHVGIGEGPR
jgi:hypothetical protein